MEVERVSEDGLSREVWRFWTQHRSRYLEDPRLHTFTSYYAKQTRPSKRHKWREAAATRFSEQEPRSYYSGIKAVDVPLPDDVIEEVRRRVVVLVYRPEVDRRGLA